MHDLRGASAEAFATLRERTVTEAAADDLFGFSRTLRADAALRRVVTDQTVEGEARSGLVRSLLAGKAEEAAVDLIAEAVALRWTRVRDLADALEQLGVIALVRSESDGRRLSDELFAVGELISDHPELRSALADPLRSEEDRAGLLAGLLDGKVLATTSRLARLALNGSHRNVNAALENFGRTAAEVRNESVARVRVAQPLSSAAQERLQQALAAQAGTPVHLNVVVEPELVGGIRVELGDDVIDGTVLARLDDVRRRLAG